MFLTYVKVLGNYSIPYSILILEFLSLLKWQHDFIKRTLLKNPPKDYAKDLGRQNKQVPGFPWAHCYCHAVEFYEKAGMGVKVGRRSGAGF